MPKAPWIFSTADWREPSPSDYHDEMGKSTSDSPSTPEPEGHADELLSKATDALYDELRALARWHMGNQNAGHTLQPTALVNEACLKLLHRGSWKSEAHFLAVASVAMRHVLVDHARKKKTEKREATGKRVTLSFEQKGILDQGLDILELDDLLTRLAEMDARCARIAQLKLFGGMTNEQIAEAVGVSRTTVISDWSVARAWLITQVQSPDANTPTE